MKEKHFFVVHSYIDDEAKKIISLHQRKEILPKKEKLSVNGPKEPLHLNLLDVFRLGQQEDFFIAIDRESEEHVYKQLQAANLEEFSHHSSMNAIISSQHIEIQIIFLRLFQMIKIPNPSE